MSEKVGETPERATRRVFISHGRSDDTREVTRLAARLREAGYKTFFDEENIEPGDCWRDKIEQAIRDCDAVLLLIGRDWRKTDRTDGASAEWSAIRECAWEQEHKRIIPVLVDDATLPRCWQEWEPKHLSKITGDWSELTDTVIEALHHGTPQRREGDTAAERERVQELELLAKGLGAAR